jgi:hypothetical protein
VITRVRLIVDLDVNAKPEKAQAIAHGILTRSGFLVVSSEIVERASAELSRVEAEMACGEPRPVCPGPDCPSCNGEACELCGAGLHTRGPDAPPCEHDVLERHSQAHPTQKELFR